MQAANDLKIPRYIALVRLAIQPMLQVSVERSLLRWHVDDLLIDSTCMHLSTRPLPLVIGRHQVTLLGFLFQVKSIRVSLIGIDPVGRLLLEHPGESEAWTVSPCAGLTQD